ncbi:MULTISPECIES: hypothetical protein [unclassified Modestobacter]
MPGAGQEPGERPFPPAAPALPREQVAALAAYAEAFLAWLEDDVAQAARHGHVPDAGLLEQLAGHRFLRDFLVDEYGV